MKKQILIIIGLFFIANNITKAQVIPNEKPQNTSPIPVKKRVVAKRMQTVPIAQTALVKIVPDADCTIYIDGELKGTIANGNILKLPLRKGNFIIKANGTNPLDVITFDFSVKIVDVDTICRIGLVDIINARLQKEAQIKEQELTQIAIKKKHIEDSIISAEKKIELLKYIKDNNLVLVEGGSFNMGSYGEQEKVAKPVHRVTVTSFYIGKYEVTQREWRAIMGENPSYFKGCDDCPVEQVSWDDVQGYIERLNQKTGKHYRLPTEAEWEYASKGGNKSDGYTNSGSNEISSVGWFIDNSNSKTHAVGQKAANELGLFDMSGNVWEWCQDWYDYNYYAYSPAENPTGPENGSSRVLRGGSWFDSARNCRVVRRFGYAPGFRGSSIGFRLILVP